MRSAAGREARMSTRAAFRSAQSPAIRCVAGSVGSAPCVRGWNRARLQVRMGNYEISQPGAPVSHSETAAAAGGEP